MESKQVAIYSEMDRDGAAYYLNSGATDEEQVAAVEELANRPEGELIEYLDQIVSMLRPNSGAEMKVAVCRAVQRAGEHGLPFCHHITALLEDPVPDVRYRACSALAALGPFAGAAEPHLEQLLEDASEAVRCGACAALGSLQSTASANNIAQLLSDKSPEVQGAACLALGKLGSAGAKRAPDVATKVDEPRSRLQAIQALAAMDEEGAKHCSKIVDALTDEDSGVRLAAAQLCGQMAAAVKGTAWSQITGLLANSDGRVRCATALALGYMGELAADQTDSIKDMLEDDFTETAVTALTAGGCRSRLPPPARKAKCAAAAALGLICQSGANVAVDVYGSEVANLLNDDDWETRMVACEALGMMGERAKDQATKVSTIFDDEKFAVRAKAAFACGKMKETETASGLSDLVADSSPSVREEAVLALAELGEDGAEYIEKVFEKINDFSPSVRAAAITALGRMGEKGQCYAGAIAQVLMDYEAPFVRAAALEALGNMQDRGAAYADIVADYLQDSLPSVRAAAAASLGKMGTEGEAYVGLIKTLTADDSEEVKKAAGKAVLALGA